MRTGIRSPAGSITWTGYSFAHLKIERNSTGVWFFASTDGSSYQLAYHHVSTVPQMEMVGIGLFTFSNSATRPEIDFDHFTVTPPDDSYMSEVRVRTGNSTSFSDASWEDWALAGPGSTTDTSTAGSLRDGSRGMSPRQSI